MHKNNFLKYIEFEKRYSKHTLISYNTDLSQFLNFLHIEYEISDVSEINHQIIRSWISSMLDSGISSRSVNRKITTLKSFYKYLMQEDVVTENPTQKIISPKNAKKLPVFVEKSKMNELLSEIKFPDTKLWRNTVKSAVVETTSAQPLYRDGFTIVISTNPNGAPIFQ